MLSSKPVKESVWGNGVKSSLWSAFQRFYNSPHPDQRLIPPINTSLARDEGGKISDISWCSVWLERNHTYPRSSSARDCPAALHSHQQWELNRFVNFPGGFLCLCDLVVESVWIRFAERQSIHSFRDAGRRGGGLSLIKRYYLGGVLRGQCQPDQQQTNLPHL